MRQFVVLDGRTRMVVGEEGLRRRRGGEGRWGLLLSVLFGSTYLVSGYPKGGEGQDLRNAG